MLESARRFLPIGQPIASVTDAGGAEPDPNFAPVGDLVPIALGAVRKGGRVVCGGIHMSDIPAMAYELLWGAAAGHSTWFDSAYESLFNVFDGPKPRPDCVPAETTGVELAQSVPQWEAQASPEPEQINPGLASSIQAPPSRD